MKYLLMCCFSEAKWNSLPDSQRNRIMDEYGEFVRDLKETGRLVSGARLGPTSAAITVTEMNGKPIITDGPFAETKEQLGGFHLIECENREEAAEIAQRIPTLAAGGRVEVRALMETE